MLGYWWECEGCGKQSNFAQVTDSRTLVAYIRDRLVPSKWDQTVLYLKCPQCHVGNMRITYEFPRCDKEVVRVVHIVGLIINGEYLPMMWESYPVASPDQRWFHFNYVNGRNRWGLNRAAVFSGEDLQKLFALYREKTGQPIIGSQSVSPDSPQMVSHKSLKFITSAFC